MGVLSKILLFSWQEQSQKIKLFKYYTKKDKNKNGQKLSSLGQEPTFNEIVNTYINDVACLIYKKTRQSLKVTIAPAICKCDLDLEP